MPFGEDIFAGIGGRTGETVHGYSSSADDIRQKFTGYQKDNETSLDFAEARMYENRYGRFTAVDPLIASGKSVNPQTFNRYVYVGNRPTNLTDKYGLEWYRNGNRFEWSSDNKTLVNGETIDENWKLVTDHVYYNSEVGWVVLDPKARDWTDHFESREEAVDFLDQPQDISLADGVDEMMLVYDGVTIVGGVVRHTGKAVLRQGGRIPCGEVHKKNRPRSVTGKC